MNFPPKASSMHQGDSGATCWFEGFTTSDLYHHDHPRNLGQGPFVNTSIQNNNSLLWGCVVKLYVHTMYVFWYWFIFKYISIFMNMQDALSLMCFSIRLTLHMFVHSKVPVEFAFIMVLRRYFWDWRFRWTMRNGEHFSMPSPFSTVLFKKDGSLVRLVGASHMSLTTQIWMLPCCFWRNICLQRLWWACNFPGIRFSTWWPKCNMEVESLTTWIVSFSLHMLPSGWSKGCLGHHSPSTRTVRITTTRSQKAQ